MKTLTYQHLNTKKKIVEIYLSQYSEKKIRLYLRDIVREYRPRELYCKNISIQEALTFVELYGLPHGYELSETLKNEIHKRKLRV